MTELNVMDVQFTVTELERVIFILREEIELLKKEDKRKRNSIDHLLKRVLNLGGIEFKGDGE